MVRTLIALLSAVGQKEKTHDFRYADQERHREGLQLQIAGRLRLQSVHLQELQLLRREPPLGHIRAAAP